MWKFFKNLKFMYNNMISRRLHDISNYPDFLADICFESCKMQQIWQDFKTLNNIR